MEYPEDMMDLNEEPNLTEYDIEKDNINRIHLYQGSLWPADDEEDLYCKRFLHLNFCSCEYSCDKKTSFRVQNNLDKILKKYSGKIYLGSLEAAIETKLLLEKGVTHVLNLSSKQYTKRYHVWSSNIFNLCMGS